MKYCSIFEKLPYSVSKCMASGRSLSKLFYSDSIPQKSKPMELDNHVMKAPLGTDSAFEMHPSFSPNHSLQPQG